MVIFLVTFFLVLLAGGGFVMGFGESLGIDDYEKAGGYVAGLAFAVAIIAAMLGDRKKPPEPEGEDR